MGEQPKLVCVAARASSRRHRSGTNGSVTGSPYRRLKRKPMCTGLRKTGGKSLIVQEHYSAPTKKDRFIGPN